MADGVGLALLGLGRAGAFHLESVRALPSAQLRVVHDVDTAKAQRVAAAEGCRAVEDAAQALSASDVDAVVVATPTQTHHRYVMAALEAGKAVLSEKPLGTSLAEIDHGFGLAERRGLPLLVAFQRRFDPAFASVIAGARSGAAGELHFVRSVSRDSPLPSVDYIRTSGGLFHDCLVHDFDLIGQVAQAEPAEVFAFGSSFLPEIGALGDVDTVVVALRFESGLLASVDASRKSVYGYDQRLEAFGSAGMLEAENRHPVHVQRAGAEGFARPRIDDSFPTRYQEAYRRELECFLDCVRGRAEVPIRHEEVRSVHRVACAAERSFREGRPVSPAEFGGELPLGQRSRQAPTQASDPTASGSSADS